MLNYFLLGFLLLILLVGTMKIERFDVPYFNTEENRMKYTCSLINANNSNNNIYNNKNEFPNNDPSELYNLYYKNTNDDGVYAKCNDKVLDLNINDISYKLGYDKNLESQLNNPMKSGDIYYSNPRKTCPNSIPVIYKF